MSDPKITLEPTEATCLRDSTAGSDVFVFHYDTVDDDPRRLESWYSLRKLLYLDEGLITQSELDPAGCYIDDYDPFSEHVLMYDETNLDLPVGTCRIIDGRQTQLQVGRQFGVQHSLNALEVSGFAVVPAYRKTFVTLGCYWLLYHRSIQGGYDEVHFEVEVPFRSALAAIGLPIRQSGPEKFVYNAINVPLMVDPAETVQALRAADQRRGNVTRFAELFERPYDGRLDISTLFALPDAEDEETA